MDARGEVAVVAEDVQMLVAHRRIAPTEFR